MLKLICYFLISVIVGFELTYFQYNDVQSNFLKNYSQKINKVLFNIFYQGIYCVSLCQIKYNKYFIDDINIIRVYIKCTYSIYTVYR